MSTPPKSIPVPDTLVPYLLNRAACAVRKMAEDELSPFGINPKHYGILATIASRGPLTQQSLGELIQIDRTTIVQLVDDLERKGAVVRGQTPGDRRSYALELTPEGKALLEKAGPRMLATQERFFEPLQPQERKELHRLLTKLVVAQPESTSSSCAEE
jgi:MarR family transcriptional regulator, lower aerobic nicotinate degradation pathway regulator